MLQVDGLLDGNVPPVRDFDNPGHAGNGQEGAVVLIVNLQGVLREKETSSEVCCQIGKIPKQNNY